MYTTLQTVPRSLGHNIKSQGDYYEGDKSDYYGKCCYVKINSVHKLTASHTSSETIQNEN
jgi:hypothetical protein